jgi:hypothetical protein
MGLFAIYIYYLDGMLADGKNTVRRDYSASPCHDGVCRFLSHVIPPSDNGAASAIENNTRDETKRFPE